MNKAIASGLVCCVMLMFFIISFDPLLHQTKDESGETGAPPPPKPLNADTKIVYFDSRYPSGWIGGSESVAFKNYLVSNGFTEKNADDLKTFMISGGVNSVVVMTQDMAPDTVADVKSQSAIIRQFLGRGGTVVCMEDIPLYYVGHSNGTSTVWDTGGMSSVLGVGQGTWNANDVVTITSDGTSKGLTHTWVSQRCASTASVTKVLASSSGGAAAWRKNYLSIAPESGFIRIWDNGGDFTSSGYLSDLLNVSQIVHVGPLNPIAGFTFTPSEPFLSDTVSFTDTSSDLDGTIASWLWNFGDGLTSTVKNPSHKYSQPDRYNVSIVVTDNDGLRNKTYQIVCVNDMRVDNSTMDKKLMMGYQGWFNCPGDGAPYGSWVHWFRNNTPDSGNLTVDYWPDISELGNDELYATNMNLPGGAPARVYSAWNAKTVMRHFQWMKDHQVDGVYVQRFSVGIYDPNSFAGMNKVVQNVKAAAEANGRVWALMWDVSGDNASTFVKKLENDWIYLVDHFNITNSPAYLRHNGKPLVSIWGMGFWDRAFTPANATELTTWFHTGAPAKYRASVMGGFPTGWCTLSGDSSTDPAWTAAYHSFDIISPWTVGRYNSNSSADSFRANNVIPDLADCTANGNDYLPVIWPGFSWYNLQHHTSPLNAVPRNGGNFYWRQVYNVLSAGCTMIYGAMFDEVDEGTAMYKLAPTSNELPAGASMVPLNIDGYSIPSDWYLRLADRAGRALRNETALTLNMPISPTDQSVKNDSRFVRLNVSQAMNPAQQYTVSVTMKNNGNDTWTKTAGFKLGSQNSQDNKIWGTNRIYLSSSDKIYPGQEKTFTFQAANSTPGLYNFQWQMVHDPFCWFGEKSINLIINVSDTVNLPPNPTGTPSGPASGFTGVSYQYTATATDPNSDKIIYGWDWNGDGTVDEWSSLVNSGTQDSRSHTWSNAGIYNVSVIVQDEHGLQSAWSVKLQVTIVDSVPEYGVPPVIIASLIFTAVFAWIVRKRK